MVLIFTREEGKLSAGTHLSEKSKGGGLALRPFAHGHYVISEKRAGLRSISKADTVDAHFALGEDADRFAEASFALEFTDRLLPDGVSEPRIFDLLKDCLGMLGRRKAGFRLLTTSYMVKVMQTLGIFPDTASPDFGLLLSEVNGDILDVALYIAEQPLERMEKLALDSEKEKAAFEAVKAFAHKHLELGALKSERLLAAGVNYS